MSFGVVAKGSNDELAIKELAVLPEIWDEQCEDVDKKETIEQGNFAGVTAAVFYESGEQFGYTLFVPREDGVFEQHTAFMQRDRGAKALLCIRAAHKAIFFTTPAVGIITKCPDWNPGSRHLAHKMGGMQVSKIQNFKVREGRMQGATLYHLTLWAWACEHHDEFQDAGEKWHETVFEKLGPHHDDDTAHNGWLGLALEMGQRQPVKAMDVYNTWASKAGYAPGKLLWADGLGHSLIDIMDAVVLNGPDAVLAVIPKCPPSPQSEQ